MNKTYAVLLVSILLCSCTTEENESLSEQKQQKETDTTEKTVEKVKKEYKHHPDFYHAYDDVLQKWNIDIEEKDISTSKGTAHIITCGSPSNPPVVLMHGMNATSTMWYPNVETLAKHFRVYAIDFILEPGKSELHGSIKTPKQMVEWYDEVIQSIQLDQFNLIGASKGGWIATHYAMNYPKKINKLVLLSPAQTFKWMQVDKMAKNLYYTMNPANNSFEKMLTTLSNQPNKIIDPYKKQLQLANNIADFGSMTIMMRPLVGFQLKKLDMPVLLMIGENDLFNSSKGLKKAKKYLAQVDTMTVLGAGHFLSVDQSDIVNNKIIHFLKN